LAARLLVPALVAATVSVAAAAASHKMSFRAPVVAAAVLATLLLHLAAGAEAADMQYMFTKEEMDHCMRVRTPNIVHTPSAIHVIVRCCGANLCSGKDQRAGGRLSQRVNRVGDDIKDCTVAMKSSTDGGNTWQNFQTISPRDSHTGHPRTGFGNGAGIYDALRHRMVVQFQFIPGGSTAPTVDTTYLQVYSNDDGRTWTNLTDITAHIRGCNPDVNNMMCQSAGNKIQTPGGRLVWAGHDHAGNVCVWYSDDGGATYHTSPRIQGNEVSLANLNGNHIIMNGRGLQFPFFPHRARYNSLAAGANWSLPTKSPLLDDDGSGCERSLVQVGGVLYSAEPQLKKRNGMTVSCSRDGGASWPSSRGVNGDNRGGYSDLTGISGGGLLMVWEDGDSGNMFYAEIGTGWC